MSIPSVTAMPATSDGPAVQPAGSSGPQVMSVEGPLATLLPWGGLRQGEVVTVAGSTLLALALLSRASREGAWCAVVGVPTLGLAAAREAGIDLERVALVALPGQRWAEVVAALADAVEVIVVGLPGRVPTTVARQLVARVRQRGVVVLALHAPGAGGLERAALRLTVIDQSWEGVGDGHGHLMRRRLTVRVEGQGRAARPRSVPLWLPAGDPRSPVGSVSTSGPSMPMDVEVG